MNCCKTDSLPTLVKETLPLVHSEVKRLYSGCGSIAPQLTNGLKILDLGCGSGRDIYVLSKMVGKDGNVLGVDMTDELLEVANRHIDYHAKQFGYRKTNVEFKKGFIEKLDELGLADNSFDIVVSNCVINLCPDKEAALKEIFRVLKPGGELYFSDVYTDRRVKEDLRQDPVLHGECLSGALYWNDFIRLSKKVGFIDPRVVKSNLITVDNDEIQEKVGDIKFESITYRFFKLEGLEDACEDFGQLVVYKGTIPGNEDQFVLDQGHVFIKDREERVCGNTYKMLAETRFKDHFKYMGDMSTHIGLFPDCGAATDTNIQESTCSC
jgi:arsenite methyltransferase